MTTSPEQLRVLLIVVALTVVSGIGDAHGFLHAARVWRGGQVVWPELVHSAAGFSFGVAMY
jgi:hypothetical protein